MDVSLTDHMQRILGKDMQQVLDEHWRLNDHGYGLYEPQRLSEEEREAKRLEYREHMLRPDSLQAFAAARMWLRSWPKLKGFSVGTSYGLKHVAEPEIGYSTNGVFIAAVLAEGFRIKVEAPWPNGSNVLINIGRKAFEYRHGYFAANYQRQAQVAEHFSPLP